MRIVQLMASPFFGGPERQMLGLALALPRDYQTTFLSFSERGLCRPLLEEVRQHGMESVELSQNFPRVRRAAAEVADYLRNLHADVVCCSGYKPDLIGLMAGHQARVPVISVSHGWTAATWRVRLYEKLDRLCLRWMDAVVCVSEAQAVKVRRTGAAVNRIHVIRNAVSLEKFRQESSKDHRQEMTALFPEPPQFLVGAAGRLSPEKGFEKLVEAAALVAKADSTVGFVVFGDGPLRDELARLIAQRNLGKRFVLAGFRKNLEEYLPHLDVLALSSYTEGLPVIVLEAMAARVPVVATAVGGVPEVIEENISGHIVPPGNAAALAQRIGELLRDGCKRGLMGRQGRMRVEQEFTFATQSEQYQRLFDQVVGTRADGKDFAGSMGSLHAGVSRGR